VLLVKAFFEDSCPLQNINSPYDAINEDFLNDFLNDLMSLAKVLFFESKYFPFPWTIPFHYDINFSQTGYQKCWS
ncbi:MAG: hypothetical protein ACK56F_27520, partial [bacterium]